MRTPARRTTTSSGDNRRSRVEDTGVSLRNDQKAMSRPRFLAPPGSLVNVFARADAYIRGHRARHVLRMQVFIAGGLAFLLLLAGALTRNVAAVLVGGAFAGGTCPCYFAGHGA
jgi:hypothetical protein